MKSLRLFAHVLAPTLTLLITGTPLVAQNLEGDNLTLTGAITQYGTGANFFNAYHNIIAGRSCIGPTCDGTEAFEQGPLRLKWSEPDILFQDSSTTTGISSNDWRLVINESTTTKFAVQDIDGGTIPFTIQGAVPTNTLWLASSGNIGMGTSIPQADLHVVSDSAPAIRLDQTSAGGKPPYIWEMQANNFTYSIRDVTANTFPIRFETGAPTSSLHLASSGFVGFGTAAPQQLLHIRSNTAKTDAFALFDANAAGSDSAFLLRQNGTVPTTWEFRNQQGSGRLNVGIAGGNTPFKIDGAAANNLLKLGINSNPSAVVVTGQLLVNNTLMNVPDYVFEEGYELRPLSEVKAFIKANSHLPEVPSAKDIASDGVDMTAMQMTLLKKVEELTLYALEQHDARANQTALIAELRATQTEQAKTIRALQKRLGD